MECQCDKCCEEEEIQEKERMLRWWRRGFLIEKGGHRRLIKTLG